MTYIPFTDDVKRSGEEVTDRIKKFCMVSLIEPLRPISGDQFRSYYFPDVVMPRIPSSIFLMDRYSRRQRFTTYGIVDPRLEKFVFIGHTEDFEECKRSHLMSELGLPTSSSQSLTRWIRRGTTENMSPVFVVLEVVHTHFESLNSHADWIRRLVSADHPLIINWKGYDVACKSRTPRIRDEASGRNRGSKWNRLLEDELTAHFKRGAGASEIARLIGRTQGAVRARLVRLSLIHDRHDLKS